MANSSIPEQLAILQSQIAEKNAQIASETSSAAEWQAQAGVPCTEKLASKREACVADKKWKAGMAAAGLSRISTLKEEVRLLTLDKQSLLDKQRANDLAAQTLATQGISANALEIKALGEADAVKTQAEITANAQADVIRRTDTDQAAKNRKMIMIAGAALLLLGLGLAVYFKFKKKK